MSAQPVGPVDGQVVPRYAGLTTFARLPRIEDVDGCDVAVVGIPFDTGVSYRPGRDSDLHTSGSAHACCGPTTGARSVPVRQPAGGRRRRHHLHPYDIAVAVRQIEEQASALIDGGKKLVSLGGDHTIAYPLLRAHHRRYGPVALVHFDAHLDTWDT